MSVRVSDTIRGIECIVGGAHVVLPADDVEQIVEYDVSPLPFALPLCAGLAVRDGELIVSLRLSQEGQSEGRRDVRAALLSTRDAQATRMAIEIERVIAFVSVNRRAIDPRREVEEARERWIGEGTRADGEAIAWLDVRRMLADLRVYGSAS